jgi:hypothetical protein
LPGDYLKAGMLSENCADDSTQVNLWSATPPVWVKLGMLLLNLIVWVDTAWRMAGV